jgi:hypothetical protein
MVRERGGEMAVQQVAGAFAVLGWDRGPGLTAPNQPIYPGQTHQPVDGVFGDAGEPVASQPRGHLPPPIQDLGPGPAFRIPLVKLVEGVEDAGIGERAGGRCSILPGPIGSRGDPEALHAQDLTGRLDRVTIGFHLVDESDYP